VSVYTDLQDALATAVTNLGLTISTRALAVRKMKQPIQRDTIDTFPCALVVVGDTPESSVPFHTGGAQLVGYVLQVVLLAGTARQPYQGEADLLAARESVRKLLQRPSSLAGVTGLLRVETMPQAPVARQAWLKTFEASALAARFFCVEAAT